MKKVVIIPARYSSSRLPGKPLLDIGGQPMIVRVCQAVDASLFDAVIVATDDPRIQKSVQNAGYQVVMTAADHTSGTDRLQEAAAALHLDDEDIVINLQGDEPLMPLANLSQVADLLVKCPEAEVATLFVTEPAHEAGNPNVVKMVTALNQRVLYFSRAGIPFDRDGLHQSDAQIKRHVGLYAYRKSALDKFVSYAEGELEQLEKLEQLRFMENGDVIVAEQARDTIPAGVDTAEDLEQVRLLFAQRSL